MIGITNEMSPAEMDNRRTSRDYRNSLLIGLIMGVFALPIVHDIISSGKYPVLQDGLVAYVGVFIGLPIICLAGIFIAKLLVSKFAGLWEFAKFVLVGVSNTIVDVGTLNLLITITGVEKGIAVSLFGAVSFIFATTNSYIWNAHWSFRTTTHRTVGELVKFFCVTLVGLFIKTLVIYLAQTYIHQTRFSPNLWANISDLMAIVFTLIWNFVGFKLFVFKAPTVMPTAPMPSVVTTNAAPAPNKES